MEWNRRECCEITLAAGYNSRLATSAFALSCSRGSSFFTYINAAAPFQTRSRHSPAAVRRVLSHSMVLTYWEKLQDDRQEEGRPVTTTATNTGSGLARLPGTTCAAC